MEQRILSRVMARTHVETRADGKGKSLVGYGAVFYKADDPGTEYRLWDDMIERIMPGAFDRAVREDDVRGLKNHDPNLLLGRTSAGTMRLAVDAAGLIYEIDLPDTTAGRDALIEVERGDMTGSSFSFIPRKVTWQETTADGKTTYIRQIEEVELFDTGPVTFPAYEATTVGSRAAVGVDAVRAELESWKAARAQEAAAGEARARGIAMRRRAVEVELESEI